MNQGSPLRVLHVPHLSEESGAPLVAARLATALPPQKFQSLTVYPSPGPLPDRMRREGQSIEVLDLLPLSWKEASHAGRRWQWFWSRVRYIRGFSGTLKSFRPDVVYIHSIMQPIPAMVAHGHGIPVVWHIHETLDYSCRMARFRRWMVKRLANTIVFCGWMPRRAFGTAPSGKRCVVIPNALMKPIETVPDARSSVRDEFQIPPDHTVLITVGGVHPRKGLDVLLNAMQRCLDAGVRNWTLLVSGGPTSASPEFRDRIERILESDALRSHVRMAGHRDDVARLLSGSDLFVLSSRGEGMPLSVLEAFAAGLPVVLTDTGDCALLAGRGKRGLCVPVESPDAFATAVQQLLEDPDLRRSMGERAQRLVKKRFPFSRFLRDVAEVLWTTAGR